MRDLLWAALARPLAIAVALLVLAATPALSARPVTLVGTFQDQVGCPIYDLYCAASDLTYDDEDQIWQGAFNLSAGGYNYLAAMDHDFVEAYGAHGQNNTIAVLTLSEARTVKFYFDYQTRWLTDNVTAPIAVLAGNFQDELGCASDYSPDCLRSWLQDVDGDGIHTFTTSLLPPGDYSTVVAIDESFSLVYGAGGQIHGDLVNFTVDAAPVTFTYDSASHVLQIDTGAVPEPSAWMLLIAGFGLSGAALRRRQRAALAALAASLAVVAGPAAAASVVDQTSLPGDGATITSLGFAGFTLPGQPTGFAQSFTVGQTGRLDAIAFGLMNFNATARVTRLSIFTGTPTSVDVGWLYQVDFLAQPFYPLPGAFTPWSSLPTIDLRAANLQVLAGKKLTFALTSMITEPQLGLIDSANGIHFNYDGGAKYALINGKFGAIGGGDFAFRTFVTAPNAAIPEPQVWLLMIGGFGMVGAGLRRRPRLA